jgi:hypothetical protein
VLVDRRQGQVPVWPVRLQAPALQQTPPAQVLPPAQVTVQVEALQ